MITRAQIRRQLRKNGGIMNTVPRTGYFLGGIKDRIRKLIPNEIANVAVKAAPFVAPFNPGIAGIMRGVGRFDQRGSLSDALKQGLLTYGGGQAARYLGGAGFQGGFGTPGDRFTSPLSSERTQSFRDLFKGKDVKKVKSIDQGEKGIGIVKKGVEATIGKVPILKELPPMVQQKLFVGGVTAGASALHSYLTENFREKLPGETIEEYLEERRKSVGTQMRTYMDNYFTFDPEYSALDEAGKDAFVARYNQKQGGRVGFAKGSPHFDPPTFSEGVPQKFDSDALGALRNPKNMNTRELIKLVQDGRSTPEILRELELRIPGAVEQIKLEEGRADQAFSIKPHILEQYNPDKRAVEEDFLYDLRENIDSNYREPREHLPIMAKGGRVGLHKGSSRHQKMHDYMSLEDEGNFMKYLLLSGDRAKAYGQSPEGGLGPYSWPKIDPEKRMGYHQVKDDFETYMKERFMYGEHKPFNVFKELPKDFKKLYDKVKGGKAKGGRVSGYGGGITATMPRIPMGTPRVNAGGIRELDYRAEGGFVPVGVKEKADDVPAMLSKNEFVMTANAVKGAGGGSVEKGAQRMYNTMKKLEGRVA